MCRWKSVARNSFADFVFYFSLTAVLLGEGISTTPFLITKDLISAGMTVFSHHQTLSIPDDTLALNLKGVIFLIFFLSMFYQRGF